MLRTSASCRLTSLASVLALMLAANHQNHDSGQCAKCRQRHQRQSLAIARVMDGAAGIVSRRSRGGIDSAGYSVRSAQAIVHKVKRNYCT